jgi:hypothetical protein
VGRCRGLSSWLPDQFKGAMDLIKVLWPFLLVFVTYVQVHVGVFLLAKAYVGVFYLVSLLLDFIHVLSSFMWRFLLSVFWRVLLFHLWRFFCYCCGVLLSYLVEYFLC